MISDTFISIFQKHFLISGLTLVGLQLPMVCSVMEISDVLLSEVCIAREMLSVLVGDALK